MEADPAPGCRHKRQALSQLGPSMSSLCSLVEVGGKPVLPTPRGCGVSGTDLAFTSFTPLEALLCWPPRSVASVQTQVVTCALPGSPQQGAHRHTEPLGEACMSPCSLSWTLMLPRHSQDTCIRSWKSGEKCRSWPLPQTLEFAEDGPGTLQLGNNFGAPHAHQHLVPSAPLQLP